MQFDMRVISHHSKKNRKTLIDVCDSDLCCTDDVENRKSLVNEAAPHYFTGILHTIFLSFSHFLSPYPSPHLMEILAVHHSASTLHSHNCSSVWHINRRAAFAALHPKPDLKSQRYKFGCAAPLVFIAPRVVAEWWCTVVTVQLR